VATTAEATGATVAAMGVAVTAGESHCVSTSLQHAAAAAAAAAATGLAARAKLVFGLGRTLNLQAQGVYLHPTDSP
jgi:hypothetical protein